MSNAPEYLDPRRFRSIDSLPIRDTGPELIDLDRVAAHIARAIDRRRFDGPTRPIDYLLHKRCLVADDDQLLVTPAGVLCFGRSPQDVLPHAVVNLTHYRGSTPDSTDAIHIERGIGGTILEQIARIEEYLHRNTHHGMTVRSGSFERVEIDEYPPVVSRELCVNMLAHRDYQEIHSAARVQLFANRIEWMNPGGLPEGITIDQILVTQRSRNPVLFSILWEHGLIEGVGQGLDTVVTVLAREQMEPPRFEDINHSFFVATVMGRPLETFYASDIFSQLTDRQRRILAVIRARGETTTGEIVASLGKQVTQRSVQRDIKALLDVRLVRAIGGSHTTRYQLYDAAPT